ncbi:helix-turn-helix domain-containing protein [Marinifilum sp.]|uniref:helix-turn-helix domain-containing protein n=1 Tax=Marinifilum sp. TaxID=2033137 RepID=UPI003BABB372
MNLSVINGFLIFAIIQSLVLAGLFSSKNKRNSADLIMTIWLSFFAVHSFLILLNLNLEGQILFKVLPTNIPLLYGPFLFLYICVKSRKTQKQEVIDIIHFIPFVALAFLSVFLYQSVWFQKILAISGVISGMAYCVLSLLQLKKHNDVIIEQFSYIEKINLAWISRLVKVLVVIWFVVIVAVILNRFFNIYLPLNVFFLCIPLFVSYLAYHGFKQQVIFSQMLDDSEDLKTNKIGENKIKSNDLPEQDQLKTYLKSGLNTEKMKAIHASLQNAMMSKELYLKANLSLAELSSELNIPQHHITQTLNTHVHKSFYDYINSFRVEAFKKRIKNGDAENFSLLGIALDCGFNSKSTFNRIFKKDTGISPSEFKKEQVLSRY